MVFVNRRAELDRIDQLAQAAMRGAPERNLAFVGVRRIGKSRLIEHYRDARATIAVAHVKVDHAAATFATLLRGMVSATVYGLARRAGHRPVEAPAEDRAVLTVAAQLGPAVVEQVARALEATAARRLDGQQLLTMALSFPVTLAETTGEPILVVADEFQALVGLARFQPFDAGKRQSEDAARERLLAVVRAQIERPRHVGWVVTGSSVRLLMQLLDRGPLMGRFDIEHVRAFDQADCAELAVAVWEEEGVRAVPAAVDRVFRLTGGHPFYADVACRAAATLARRLECAVTSDLVDAAFGTAVGQPNGQVYIACKEMYDSLRERAPTLGGVVDVLAAIQPAGVTGIAERLGIDAPPLYRAVDALKLMDVVAETPDGYVLADPMFRFWVARATDPAATPPVPADLRTAQHLARRFEEAYMREREMHGHLSEGFVRNLCRSFRGQSIEGRRFGAPGGHVRLPVVEEVTSIEAADPTGTTLGLATPAVVELDLRFGTDQVWLGEVKRTADRATADDIDALVRKAAFLRRVHALRDGPLWFVSFYGFEQGARDAARAHGVYTSSFRDLLSIQHVVAAAVPGHRPLGDDRKTVLGR